MRLLPTLGDPAIQPKGVRHGRHGVYQTVSGQALELLTSEPRCPHGLGKSGATGARVVREMTRMELGLVEALLDRYGPTSAYLQKQLQEVTVTPINGDESIIRFNLPSTAVPAPMPKIHFVPIEATAKDADGTPIHVLLHVRHGVLYELEYVKETPLPILRKPQAQDLTDFTTVD